MTYTDNGPRHYFVGWDVGGWNCDRNSKSRDAIVVINRSGTECGTPWRGNLRSTINENAHAADFLSALLTLCDIEYDRETVSATIAIDAPLAFPAAFYRLIAFGETLDCVADKSAENPYLFRFTERRLVSEVNISPLSAIKDMIGSQATKAIHLMSRFDLQQTETGVWSDGGPLTAIETYPSLCRARLDRDRDSGLSSSEADIADARICAEIAYDFEGRREELEPPPPDAPAVEGWIWAPNRRSADVRQGHGTTTRKTTAVSSR